MLVKIGGNWINPRKVVAITKQNGPKPNVRVLLESMNTADFPVGEDWDADAMMDAIAKVLNQGISGVEDERGQVQD